MRGLNIVALLSGIAIAGSISLQAGLAQEQPASFNELDSGRVQRTYSLDELFSAFRKQPAAIAPATVAAKTEKHRSVDITPSTRVQHVQSKAHNGTIAHNGKTAVKTAAKHVEPAHETVVEVATAKTNSAGPLLPVSQAVASNQCTVVTASLDHPGSIPKYHPGEQMSIKVAAQADCNIIVFDYDAQGHLTQLFPNQFETNSGLRAGQSLTLGGPDSKYTLDIAGKGLERIFVYAYPLSDPQITVAMNAVPNTPFRSVDISADQYKALVASSREYFSGESHDRSVTVKAKAGVQPVSAPTPETAGNKLELVFEIAK